MKKKGIKLVVIGAGSSYTPELLEGLIHTYESFPVTELHLVDIAEGQEKLAIISALATRMFTKAQIAIDIFSTTDRREALKNADFVCTQIRVGGLDARAQDELIPLKHGCIGQETTGAGGFAKALRTIPAILDICRDIEALAPQAFLINFTNPAGIITEAVLKYTNVKVIGLCNLPIGTKIQVAKIVDVDVSAVDIEMVGINHLNWTRNIRIAGKDMTEQVITRMAEAGGLTVENIPEMDWGERFIQDLGMLPCSYLTYYYLKEGMLQDQLQALKENGTRAEIVKATEKELFELYQHPDLQEKPVQLEARGGAYYSDAAVQLMAAIYNNHQNVQIVNVQNNRIIPFLEDDAVIEVKCVIGAEGARPVALASEIPQEIKGLLQIVKNFETLTIEAAMTKDYNKALHALTTHPLIGTVTTARKILDDMIHENDFSFM